MAIYILLFSAHKGVGMTERIRPETIAVTLAQHAHDTEPEPQAYLARVVAEILEAEPGVREHVFDWFFVELTEGLQRRGERDAIMAVLDVQNSWATGGLDG